MRGAWAEISEEEIIPINFVQGNKNPFLVIRPQSFDLMVPISFEPSGGLGVGEYKYK
jgi:hypothetical protein